MIRDIQRIDKRTTKETRRNDKGHREGLYKGATKADKRMTKGTGRNDKSCLSAYYCVCHSSWPLRVQLMPHQSGVLSDNIGYHSWPLTHDLTSTSQVTTCSKFGAMGYTRFHGRVSGTVGLCCARHMMIRISEEDAATHLFNGILACRSIAAHWVVRFL